MVRAPTLRVGSPILGAMYPTPSFVKLTLVARERIPILMAPFQALGAPAIPAGMGCVALRRIYVDAVVCAAANAVDLPPRVVKRALRKAFERAKEMGVSLEGLAEALSDRAPGKKAQKNAP